MKVSFLKRSLIILDIYCSTIESKYSYGLYEGTRRQLHVIDLLYVEGPFKNINDQIQPMVFDLTKGPS